jgi:hypothetical protein
MLYSLGLALRLKHSHNISEVVVSDGVFRQVLKRCRNPGSQRWLRLNEPHDSLTYRFMHRIRWQGILFLHFSRSAFVYEEPG